MRHRRASARRLAVALSVAGLLGCASAGAAAATAWRAPVTLPGSTGTDQQQAVAVDGDGDVIAVWARFAGKNESRHIVQAAFRRAGGRFQAPVTLSTPGVHADDPQVAFDRFGDAIVVWHEFHGSDIVRAAFRPRGGHFGAGLRISRPGVAARNPQLAFDRAGDAFTLWTAGRPQAGVANRVQWAIRPFHGRFDVPVSRAAGAGEVDSPRLAVGPGGDAVTVWRQCNTTTFGCDGGTYIVREAIAPANGSLGTPASLSAPGRDAENPQVAIDQAGGALVVWDRFSNTVPVIESAWRPPGASFTPTVDLATAAVNPQVALTGSGNAVVAWEKQTALNGEESAVQTVTGRAGQPFGSPQSLSPPESEANLALTMNPSGDAVAAWQDCTIGSLPCRRYVIQSATRRPAARFGAPTVISPTTQDSFFPGLAIDPAGDALAIWMRDRADIGSALLAEFRFPR